MTQPERIGRSTMATKSIDAIDVSETGEVWPRGYDRRGLLSLFSRCLLMMSLPIASMQDALASNREVPVTEIARDDLREAETRTRWTAPMDRQLIARWTACEAQPLIARRMGVSTGTIRARATRLHLPARDRASLVWS